MSWWNISCVAKTQYLVRLSSEEQLQSLAELEQVPLCQSWLTLHFQRACAPLKTCQNQKSFWIPSKQPPNTCGAGWAIFFLKNMFSWDTLIYMLFYYWNPLSFHTPLQLKGELWGKRSFEGIELGTVLSTNKGNIFRDINLENKSRYIDLEEEGGDERVGKAFKLKGFKWPDHY